MCFTQLQVFALKKNDLVRLNCPFGQYGYFNRFPQGLNYLLQHHYQLLCLLSTI